MIHALIGGFGTVALAVAGNAAWRSIEEPKLQIAYAAGVQDFALRVRPGSVEVTSELRDLKTGEVAITTRMAGPDTIIRPIRPSTIYYVKILLRNGGRAGVNNLRIPLFANVRGRATVNASGNVGVSLETGSADNTIVVPTLQPHSKAVLTYQLSVDPAQAVPERVWIKMPYVSSDQLGAIAFPDTPVRLAVAYHTEERIDPGGAVFGTIEVSLSGKRGPLLPAAVRLVPAYFAKPSSSEW